MTIIAFAQIVLVFAENPVDPNQFAFVFDDTPVTGIFPRTVIQKIQTRNSDDGNKEVQVLLYRWDRSSNSRSPLEGSAAKKWISSQSFEALKVEESKLNEARDIPVFSVDAHGKLRMVHPVYDRVEEIIPSLESPICIVPSANDELQEVSNDAIQKAMQDNSQKTVKEIQDRLLADFQRIRSLKLDERYDLDTSEGLISARNELWKKIHDWYPKEDDKAIQLATALTLFGEFRGHWTPAHGFYFMKVMENRRDQNFLDYQKKIPNVPSLRIIKDEHYISKPVAPNWLKDTIAPLMLEPNGIDAWDGVSGNNNLVAILQLDRNRDNDRSLSEISQFVGEYVNKQWEIVGEYPELDRLSAYDSPSALEASTGSRDNPNMHLLTDLPGIRNIKTNAESQIQSEHFRGGEDDALRNVRLAKERKQNP